MADYRSRLIDPLITELHAELPALLLVGPRATGKTTTAARHARTIVRLDRDAEAASFRADPDAALRDLREPVLLDEWQAVPGILGAVKRTLDNDTRPGRFLLTGSVRADLDSDNWAGTGRVVRLTMYPLTVGEQLAQTNRPFIERVADAEDLVASADSPDLRGYLDLALRGGFPEAALDLSETARRRWLASYVDQLVSRDALTLEPGRDPTRLGRYLEAYAVNSAGLAEDKTLYDAAGINRKTALAYDRLLQNLLVVDELPSWSSNRLKRLVRSSKRHMVDPSLLVGVLGIDTGAIMKDGDLLGRVLDTFVTAQIRTEAALSDQPARLYHLRQEQGRHEIDLIIEIGGQDVIAIEIKASSSPTPADARHLDWLRSQIGDRFIAGVVLHTGPSTYKLGERLTAAPISTLWA
ncbi:MAG: ATP-binding protein [Actinobacteria bacterium]|nr:ATP-binding protein [Actinomycetota bacterium]